MREAFRKGDAPTLTSNLPLVQGHVLEPLAAYWELRARLDLASTDEVRGFLRRYAGTYYEDRLRNDWLLLLGKRGDWDNFSIELPLYRMNDDREVQCYAQLYDHLRNRTNVTAKVRELWLAQKDADEGCSAAARTLLQEGQMPADVAWMRARLGMENGRQRVAAQAVGLINPAWSKAANDIFNYPSRYLDEKLTAVWPRTKEFVTLALVRLAAKDYADAADQAGKLRWRTQLLAEERSWVWGEIGKFAAQKLSDDAPSYFEQAQNRYLNDDLLIWKTRAALRAGDWKQVHETIDAMSDALQREPVWSYWHARALMALKVANANTQATALLQRIAGNHGFYEQLALEALGQATTPSVPPLPLTREEKDAARQNPGLQRALRAIALGLRPEGVREWNYTTNLHTPGGMGERELLAAADLACSLEVWDRCINTSQRTRVEVDYTQRFPMPFKDLVVKRAKDIGLDPAYVYGLIRQESRFVMDARSGVGASGLMQVMPATAQWTAKRMGMADFKPAQLNDRDTNIAIGTAYLKYVLDDADGSVAMPRPVTTPARAARASGAMAPCWKQRSGSRTSPSTKRATTSST